jgi:hypothetical protein
MFCYTHNNKIFTQISRKTVWEEGARECLFFLLKPLQPLPTRKRRLKTSGKRAYTIHIMNSVILPIAKMDNREVGFITNSMNDFYIRTIGF